MVSDSVRHSWRGVAGLSQAALISFALLGGSDALAAPAADDPKPAVSPAKPKPSELEKKTTAELVAIAKSRSRDPELRVQAIQKLGEVKSDEERENGVIDAMIQIIQPKDPKNVNDLFVRRSAIQALGRIQTNGNRAAKTKYVIPFIVIMKKAEENSLVRKAVALVFKNTLEIEALQDQDAYKAMLEIAKNNKEPNLGLRGEIIEGVGEFGSMDGLETLTTILNETEPLIKERAAYAIYSLLEKNEEAAGKISLPTVNKLIELLGDEKVDIELRVGVMKVIARLAREGNTSAKNAIKLIVDVVKGGKDDKLVIGAVEALGIVGAPEAVDALKVAYDDYFDKANPNKETDVPVRRAIMKSLRTVLTVQETKRPGPDLNVVKECALLLVKAIDDDGSTEVKESAVYSLGYLYPPKFQAEHKNAAEALIFLMRETKEEKLKPMCAQSLEAITGMDFALDARRWLEWFDKKYGGARKTK